MFKLKLPLAFLLLFSLASRGQAIFPDLSLPGSLSQMVGNTRIEIDYSRPLVRKRTIFGGLVPWNKLWRTGAGTCTTIQFDQDILIGNQDVKAGKYALLSIPKQQEWVIILNTDTTLFTTAATYDSHKDATRFIVKPSKSPRHYESLSIDMDIQGNNAKIYISWDAIQVSFDLITTTDEKMEVFIDQHIRNFRSTNPYEYSSAARYYFYNNKNYKECLVWLIKSIELDTSGSNIKIENHKSWMRRFKMDIYERQHLFSQALAEAKKGLEFPRLRTYKKEAYRERDLLYWQAHINRINRKVNKSEAPQ